MPGEFSESSAIVVRALELVPPGGVIGLGTGRAATAFVNALGRRYQAGLHLRGGVPTSEATAALARLYGIPLLTLDQVVAIDVDFDGADEVDPGCNLIKGYGGALVREKVVAAMSKRLVVLVGPEKLVPALGTHGKLPVEVVPFGVPLAQRELRALGFTPVAREHASRPFVTDNGNSILDCGIPVLRDAAAAELAIRAIPGVVGTGLFVGMADTVLIERGDGCEERRRHV